MVWQFTEALDEVETGYGPNLLAGDYQAQNPGWVLDGDTWSGEGSLHLHEGDPYTGPISTSDATHVVTADVMASSEVTVTWAVDLGTSDGDVTLGPWSETIPGGAWVTVWQEVRTPPGTLGGSPTFTTTGPVQVRAPRSSLVTDQTVVRQVVTGDPDGARVVLAGDALTAYDQTGTETARIAGEGGEFIGGSFRTSNALPGQVVLSDTANQGTPGISIEPEDDTGYDVLPSIGPGPDDMRISGGVSTAGDIAGAQFRAGGTSLYWNGPGATGGGAWATVDDGEAGLTYRPDRTNADYESAIRARTNDAVVYSEGPNGTGFLSASPLGGLLQYVSPGDPTARSQSRATATPEYLMLERKVPGVNDLHRLVLDDDGVWVQTVFGANPVSHNLFDLISRVNDLEARVAALEA